MEVVWCSPAGTNVRILACGRDFQGPCTAPLTTDVRRRPDSLDILWPSRAADFLQVQFIIFQLCCLVRLSHFLLSLEKCSSSYRLRDGVSGVSSETTSFTMCLRISFSLIDAINTSDELVAENVRVTCICTVQFSKRVLSLFSLADPLLTSALF